MIIYGIINKLNHKIYVGMSTKDDIDSSKSRPYQHLHGIGNSYSKLVFSAVRKYGIENFLAIILHRSDCASKELKELEKWYILHLNTFVNNGYNLTKGGDGGNTRIYMTDGQLKDYDKRISETMKISANKIEVKQKRLGTMTDALIGIEWEPQFTLLDYPGHTVHFIRKDSFDYKSRQSEGYLQTVERAAQISICRYVPFQVEPTSVYIVLDDDYYPSYYDGMSSYYLDVDISVENAEVKTLPVKLDILEDHIEFCTNYLSHFVEDMSELSKAGVFLPVSVPHFLNRSAPSKHVNVSFPLSQGYSRGFSEGGEDLWSCMCEAPIFATYYNELPSFRTSVKVKNSFIPDLHPRRLHITVPYNFTEYSRLVDLAQFIWIEKDSKLLKQRILDLARYLDYWDSLHKQKDPILICHTSGKKKVKIVNGLI